MSEGQKVIGLTVVFLWFLGFFLVPRDWLTLWSTAIVWVPLLLVGAVNVLAWVVHKLST